MSDADASELRLWCFLDGKPGHQNQTLGLVDSLRRCCALPVVVHEIQAPTGWPARLFGGTLRHCRNLATPHCIVGAGHATHLPVLRARRLYGGRSIILMKPSLPISCFDLCVIPDVHDVDPHHPHVFVTRGVLNRIQPSKTQDPSRGTILLGGPSAHFQWIDAEVVDQLSQVLRRMPHIRWTVATSRRTPRSFIETCRGLAPPVNFVHHETVGRDWLPEQIQNSRTIWVTEDSVSMVYEAVTSGAAVGSIQLTRPRPTRVTRGIDRLVQSGRITPWDHWRRTGVMNEGRDLPSEAERTAREILCRFYPPFLQTVSTAA